MHKGKEKVLYNPRVTFWTYYRKSAGRDLWRVWFRREMTTGFLAGKSEGERPLARPRRGWEYEINISLKEMRWNGVGWIYLSLCRKNWWAVVNTVMNFVIP